MRADLGLRRRRMTDSDSDFGFRGSALDPVRSLQFSNELHDPLNFGLPHLRLWWHVAKAPMMRPDAAAHSQVEGGVSMMAGLVDGVDERRTVVAPRGVLPVASGAALAEGGCAVLRDRRQHRNFDIDDHRLPALTGKQRQTNGDDANDPKGHCRSGRYSHRFGPYLLPAIDSL